MTPLLKNNIMIYFIILNLLIILIFLTTILIIIMIFKIKKKKIYYIPLSILKLCLPFFSVCFFGQIFLLLRTIFDCQSGFAYVSKELVCRKGIWFSIDAPLAGIAMVLLIILALITNTLYYKSSFVKNGSDILKKTNCFPDIMLLFTKICVISLFVLDGGNDDEHWAILFFIIFITGTNALFNYKYQNRLNKGLVYINNIFCFMPFLGFCSLFIGKIFSFLDFNGSIFLFLFCIFFEVLYITFYTKKKMSFVLIDHRYIENPIDYLNYIHEFFKIAINTNNSRKEFAILKSFIDKKEEKCFDLNCPLKKYINIKSFDEFDNIFPLLQFCEKLFEFGISKFPNDISLTINYSMFLIFEMNHNKKALITLNSIKTSFYNFQENYNIYRCRILIDEYIDKKNKNKNDFNFFEYNKKIYNFKLLVSKSTTLYYDFWKFIIINKLNFTYNYNDLNKLGSKILKMNQKIDEEYNSLFSIKYDNYDLIKFYSQYIENVLSDQEKFKKIKTKSPNDSNNDSISQEIQFSNFNINTLKEKDFVKYLILSGDKKNLFEIIDISMNLCSIFGYNKNELIGKNINILIPELLIKIHNKLLLKYHERAKSLFYKELFEKDNYIPEYLEKEVYAISKSKYLIPLKLKVYFVQTESNEFVYLAEIMNIQDFQKYLVNNDNELKYVVMTDGNFYIYSFTSNCINQLMLNDSYLNSNYTIINYIKQLKIDCLKYFKEFTSKENYLTRISINDRSLDNSNKNDNHKISLISNGDKIRIKRKSVDNYLREREIVWKINKNPIKEDNIFFHSLIDVKETNLNLINNGNTYEKEFLMQIKKIVISEELIGYLFIFRQKPTKKLYNQKNLLNYKNVSKNYDQRRDSKIKIKQYSYLFEVKSSKKKNFSTIKGKDFQVIKRCNSPKKIVSFRNNNKEEMFNKFKVIVDNDSSLSNNQSSKNISSKNVSQKYNTDITNNNNSNNNYVSINGDYIPESLFHFSFDITKHSYKPNYEKNEELKNKLNETLSLEANRKINDLKKTLINKKFINNSSCESNSETESEENESYSSSSESLDSKNSSYNIEENNEENNEEKNEKKNEEIKNDSKKVNNSSSSVKNKENENKEKTPEEVEHRQSKKKNNFLNNYYKVNLSKINLSIYDFNKEMAIDKGVEKESKMEKLIKDAQSRSNALKDSGEFHNILHNNFKKGKKASITLGEAKSLKKQITNDKKSFENKITEAINKEEDEEKIVKTKRYSIFLAIILMICSGFYLYYEIKGYQDYVSILGIIKNVVSINYSNKMGVFYMRELTLLNIPDTGIKGGNYSKIFWSNKNEYISFVKKNILDLFVESQMSMIEFLGTSVTISKKGENDLTQNKLITKLTNFNFSNNIIKNNIFITIVQLNSFFYNLASSTSPVQQNHNDLYGFIYNSLNSFELAIVILTDSYNNELQFKFKSYRFIFHINLCISLIIYIFVYAIAMNLFSKVVHRKKNYMGVFFNLNLDFIIESINKSEDFISKFKLLEENKTQEGEFSEEEEESKNLNNKKKNYNIIRENTLNMKMNINNDIKKREKRYKCGSSFIFKFLFGFFLIIIYLIQFFYGYIYSIYLKNNITNISKFYFHLMQFHLNIIEYYNIYREYLFDENFIISNFPTYEKLQQNEKSMLGNWSNDVNNITYYIKTLINNNDLKKSLNRPLCSYINTTDYFKSENDCIKGIGNGFEQDIYSFCYGFIDEIRIKKHIIKVILELNLIIGNLTEYETETWHDKYYEILNKEKSEDYLNKTSFRLDLFNSEYLHSSSNIIFINIILPYFNEERKIIFDYLTIKGKQTIYYILFSVSTAGLLALYFFYWIPMLNKLNKVINETKNMLKLIPIHILISDVNLNIKKILNIKFKE